MVIPGLKLMDVNGTIHHHPPKIGRYMRSSLSFLPWSSPFSIVRASKWQGLLVSIAIRSVPLPDNLIVTKNGLRFVCLGMFRKAHANPFINRRDELVP